jgi:hypothetical protein
MSQVGNAIVNEVFGYYKARTGVTINKMQVTVLSAPTGASLTVQVINPAGASPWGANVLSASITAGNTYAETTPAFTASLATSAEIRVKITAIGSIVPGGYIFVNFL